MKSNPSIFIIVSLVVAGAAYWYFFTGNTGNQPPLTASTPSSLLSEAPTKFQTLVTQMQSLSVHTAIFSDPRFAALVNLATPIAPEASGRQDPFALVPGVKGN